MTQVITALSCPCCSGPVLLTSTTCPNCGVGLVINYAELLGVSNYTAQGRDVILDAALLTIVKREADKYGIEVIPTIAGNTMVIYVRNVITNKLATTNYANLESVEGGGYNAGPWFTIQPENKISGGRLYKCINGRSYEIVESEVELGNLPMIQQWVRCVIGTAGVFRLKLY